MNYRRLILAVLIGAAAAVAATALVYHQNGPNGGLLGRAGIKPPKK
jgi:hypothetical protein